MAAYLTAVYALFGGNTVSARIALGIVASAAFAFSARTVLAICGLPGRLPRARTAAAAILLLLSIMLLFDAAVTMRQWDQPFAALALVLGWQVLERARAGLMRFDNAGVAMGSLAGLGCLLSPAIFPSLLGALALVAWIGRRRRGVQGAVGVLVIADAILLPWGLRNETVLGRFIVTRSNFPLEMAIGNAPGADGTSNSGSGQALHPHQSLIAAGEMANVGELAYMVEVGAKARHWIAARPEHFLLLTLHRIRLSFVPSRPMVGWCPGLGTAVPFVITDAFGIMVLAALISALALRWRQPSELALPALLFVALPLAPYAITHVNLRYLYTTLPADVLLIVLTMAPVFDLLQSGKIGSATRPLGNGTSPLTLEQPL